MLILGYNTVFGSKQVDMMVSHFELLSVNVLGTLKYDQTSITCEEFMILFVPKLEENGYIVSFLRGSLGIELFRIYNKMGLGSTKIGILTDSVGYRDIYTEPELYVSHYLWMPFVNSDIESNRKYSKILRDRTYYNQYPNNNEVYILDGLLLWREAVIKTKSFSANDLMTAFLDLEVESIGGPIKLGTNRYSCQTGTLFQVVLDPKLPDGFKMESYLNLLNACIPRFSFYLFSPESFHRCSWPDDADLTTLLIRVGLLYDLSGVNRYTEYRIFIGIITTIYYLDQENLLLGKTIIPIIRDTESNKKVAEGVQFFIDDPYIQTFFGCADIECLNIVQTKSAGSGLVHFFTGRYTGESCTDNMVSVSSLPYQLLSSFLPYILSKGSSVEYFILTDESELSIYYEALLESSYNFLEKKGRVTVKSTNDNGDISSIIRASLSPRGFVYLLLTPELVESSLLSGSIQESLKQEYMFVSSTFNTDDYYKFTQPNSINNIYLLQSYHETSSYEGSTIFLNIIRQYGSTPYVTVSMETAYSAVMFWYEACRVSNSHDPKDYMSKLFGLKIKSGSGELKMLKSLHTTKMLYVMKFEDDGKITKIFESKSATYPMMFRWPDTGNKISTCDFKDGNGIVELEYASIVLALSATGSNLQKDRQLIYPMTILVENYFVDGKS